MSLNQAIALIANSQFGAAVGGGVIGALAGAVPAWLLARSSDRRVVKERRHAQGFRIYTTLGAILNSWLTTRQMVDKMLERPVDARDPAPIQRRVNAIVGVEAERIHFSPDDIVLLMIGNDTDLITDCELLARRHNAINSAFEEYKRQKERHTQILLEAKSHEVAPSGQVTSKVPPELIEKLRLSEAVLESVVSNAVQMLHEGTDFLLSVAERYNEFVDENLKGKSGGVIMMLDDARALYPRPDTQ